MPSCLLIKTFSRTHKTPFNYRRTYLRGSFINLKFNTLNLRTWRMTQLSSVTERRARWLVPLESTPRLTNCWYCRLNASKLSLRSSLSSFPADCSFKLNFPWHLRSKKQSCKMHKVKRSNAFAWGVVMVKFLGSGSTDIVKTCHRNLDNVK